MGKYRIYIGLTSQALNKLEELKKAYHLDDAPMIEFAIHKVYEAWVNQKNA